MTESQLRERLLSVQHELRTLQQPDTAPKAEDVARLRGVLRELNQGFVQLGESDPFAPNRQEIHRLIKVLNDLTVSAVVESKCDNCMQCLRNLHK